jgi:uncharacterized protein (TIGR01370 family)
MRRLMWMLAICAGTAAAAENAAGPSDGAASSGAAVPVAGATAEGAAAESTPVLPAPAARPCAPSADRYRAMRLHRALADGFGVQYWGERYTAEELAEQPHGLLIIEGAKVGAPYSESGREVFFTPDEIAAISRGGERPVLGYLNAGEIEHYRDYWIERTEGSAGEVAASPGWFGPHTGHGEHLAAYWAPEWQDVLIARVDRLMALGVDGLFLDDVLHYYSHATHKNLRWPDSGRAEGPQDASGLAKAMMELVIAVAERVRDWDCGALVIVNNGVFIGRDADEAADGDGARPVFEAYLAAIDAILVENALSPSAHPDTRAALDEDYRESGLTVLTLDVLSRFGGEDLAQLRQRMAEEAREAGFYPYLVEDSAFNRLWAPIAPPKQP